MSDALAPVVPIRPGMTARYGDNRAVNDIHAVLAGDALPVQVTTRDAAGADGLAVTDDGQPVSCFPPALADRGVRDAPGVGPRTAVTASFPVTGSWMEDNRERVR